MSQTHDYETYAIFARGLRPSDVLVGESGGLSAIYGKPRISHKRHTVAVETEHGKLLFHRDSIVQVLKTLDEATIDQV